MSVKIIGVGNENRCDDSIGLLIARKLKKDFPDVIVVESNGDGSKLLTEFRDVSKLIIIDAAFLEEKNSGEIISFNPHQNNLIKIFKSYSTHSFGLSEALSLSMVFQTLPENTHIIAIFASNFEFGNSLSFDFDLTYEKVKDEVKKILNN